jgi:hypothetical protein
MYKFLKTLHPGRIQTRDLDCFSLCNFSNRTINLQILGLRFFTESFVLINKKCLGATFWAILSQTFLVTLWPMKKSCSLVEQTKSESAAAAQVDQIGRVFTLAIF